MTIKKDKITPNKELRIVGNQARHEFKMGEKVRVKPDFLTVSLNGNFECRNVYGEIWWVNLNDVEEVPLSSHELLSDFESDITVADDLGEKYKVTIPTKDGKSDVYDVLVAFNVTCPAASHAIKKLLCSGNRGHKDVKVDKQEAINSIRRSLELDETRK